MSTRSFAQATVVLVLGALVPSVGCGGGDSTPPANATSGGSTSAAGPAVKEACDVFTLDLARQVLGDTAKRSEVSAPTAAASSDIASSTCTYEAEDPTPASRFATVVTASVLLNTSRTPTGRSSNRSAIESNRKMFEDGGEKLETVTGLGDAAFFIGGVISQLHVLAGGGSHLLIVSVRAPDDDHRGAAERLARQLIAKL